MKKMLVTGGTVFVSKCVAEYYVKKGYEVYVLNRNHHPQPEGTKLIEADRHNLGMLLKDWFFDVIMDITAYTAEDIVALLNGVGGFEKYILLSSSAVYPETCPQPFSEAMKIEKNKYWGSYSTGKIEAEKALLDRVPDAYILRPPYLYGAWNNLYREAFVFDCALENRKFYLPSDGQMKLQFLHIDDLCKFTEILLEKKPANHIFNLGNEKTISVKDWVDMCYGVVGKKAKFVMVHEECEQRNYFCFYNYEYCLDISRQKELMPQTSPMEDGLRESFLWYGNHTDKVNKKPYFEYIDEHFVMKH